MISFQLQLSKLFTTTVMLNSPLVNIQENDGLVNITSDDMAEFNAHAPDEAIRTDQAHPEYSIGYSAQ